MRLRVLLACGFTAVFSAAAMADTPPTLLGAFKDWSAFQANTTGDGKTCYIMAQPHSSVPAKAKRDPIYFLISDWPRRKAKGEMQIIPPGTGHVWTSIEEGGIVYMTIRVDPERVLSLSK